MARSYDKSIYADARGKRRSSRFQSLSLSLSLSFSLSLSVSQTHTHTRARAFSLFDSVFSIVYKSVNRKPGARRLRWLATRIDMSRCFCAKVKREIYNLPFYELRPIINRVYPPLERTTSDRQAGYTCGGGEGIAQLYANYGRNPWSLGIAGLSSAIVAANATAGLSGFAVPRQ